MSLNLMFTVIQLRLLYYSFDGIEIHIIRDITIHDMIILKISEGTFCLKMTDFNAIFGLTLNSDAKSILST